MGRSKKAVAVTNADEWPAEMVGLGERLKFRREQLGMSQVALAELSGVDKTTISNLEKGKRLTRASSLTALAKALKVPPPWLFFNVGVLPEADAPEPGTMDGRRREAKA